METDLERQASSVPEISKTLSPKPSSNINSWTENLRPMKILEPLSLKPDTLTRKIAKKRAIKLPALGLKVEMPALIQIRIQYRIMCTA